MDTKNICSIRNMRNYFLGCITIFLITFAAVEMDYQNLPDFILHGEWAAEMDIGHLENFLVSVPYPIWHIGVKILYSLLGFRLDMAAAIMTAGMNVFAFWAACLVWNYLSTVKVPVSDKVFWCICLFIMGPLYVPCHNDLYYLGQGTGNTWHNPTNIAVKGFAILGFALLVYLLDSEVIWKEQIKWYCILSIILCLSAMAKPSFLQGIIPGIILLFGCRMVFKGVKSIYKNIVGIILAFLPPILVVLVQFMLAFLVETPIHDGDGIGIEFGRVLKQWTPNLFISFLLAFAFPLWVLLFNVKNLIKETSIQLVVCYEICSYMESLLLYEKGERELVGNWCWGSYISMFIVWMCMLIKYFEILSCKEDSRTRRITLIGGGILLFLQVLCGSIYWFCFASGQMMY